MVKNITKKEFDQLFVKSDDKLSNNEGENCILKFTAKWCGPCKMMAPILEKISTEKNINVYEVDVDEEFELSEMFNIRSIPTIYFVSANSGELKHQIGAISQVQMEKLIQKHFGE
jgi:thioredoxin